MDLKELSVDGIQKSIGKTTEKISLFDTAIASIIGYSMIHNMYPVYDLYACVMLSVGIGSIAIHFKGKSKMEKLFEKCKLFKDEMYPQLKEKKTTPYGYCMRFSLPLGMSTDDFIKQKKPIEQYLDRRVEIKYAHKNVLIEVYEKELECLYPFEYKECKGLEFLIGYTYGGKEVKFNLADKPHVLIAGETGSGKSTVLRSVITTLILKGKMRIHLIDLKGGVEFNIFQRSKYVKSYSKTRAEAEATLIKLNNEVDKRYQVFYENECNDIIEYNKNNYPKMRYEVVVIDEFADLKTEKGSLSIVETLGAKARACGIHVIVSTQRPDAEVLNGRIKANIPIHIGLSTVNEINSRIIIDHSGLEKLRGKGHGILQAAGNETEFQAMNLEFAQAKELIKHTFVEKKKETIKTDGEVKDFGFMKVIK